MNSDDAARILARSPLLRGLEPQVLRTVIEYLRAEHWMRRKLVMSPPDTVERFYVLLKGRVKITRQNPRTAREVTLFLLGPGDGFDVVSLLDGQPHPVTAVTLDPVDALSGPIDQWQQWLDTYPAFRRAIRRYVDDQMRQLSDLVDDLALHDTMSRLAHLILRHFDSRANDRANLIKDLPHEELAHMIGTVRVVVNRLLGQLKREGIVDIQGGELHVLNLEKLLLKAERHLQDTAPR